MGTAENVEAKLGFRVENELLFHGDRPRPATADEQMLWEYAVTTTKSNEELQGRLAAMAALGADAQSYLMSNEAYREQLQKLHDFLAHEYSQVNATTDAIEFAMDELVKSFKHVCEPPLPPTMKQTLDARAVADGFGTPAENRL